MRMRVLAAAAAIAGSLAAAAPAGAFLLTPVPLQAASDGLPGAPGPFVTKLAATTSFGFSRHATYTIVSRIDLKKLAGGETATIRCSGAKRCAFRTRTYKALEKGTRTFGRALLKGRRLPAGTAISVSVTRAGVIGTSTVLKVRRRGPPQIIHRCLAPGASKPTACT